MGRTGVAAAASAVVAFSATASAWPTYLPMNPNSLAIPWTIAIGHYGVNGGGPLNQYGRDFSVNSHTWDLCLACVDSDNDGWTNGWELGDPCGVWYYSPHSAPHPCWTDDISHPGNSSSVPETRSLDWNAACGFNPCEKPEVVGCVQKIVRARKGDGVDDDAADAEGASSSSHRSHKHKLGMGGAGQRKSKGEHPGTRGGHLHEARRDARAAQAVLLQEEAASPAAAAAAAALLKGGHGQCSGGGGRPPAA